MQEDLKTKNSTYYLNNNTYFWTMSPLNFTSSSAQEWSVYSWGALDYNSINSTYFVLRPVISLNSDTLVTGSGTVDNPYVVQ